MTNTQTPNTDPQPATITVRVLWGSKSSGGKWGKRAIEHVKAAGGTFNPADKTWTLPADAELVNSAWDYLEIVD